MTTDPIHLLRTLALGGRSAPAATTQGGVEANAFADLLRQAQSGQLRSDRPVEIDPDVDLELSDAQLDRLAIATDKAEAAGLRTALVLVDGKKYTLDVQQRRITGAAEDVAGIVGGVDGIIDLAARPSETARGMFGPLVMPPSEKDGGGRARSIGLPMRSENASLLRVLSNLREAQ